MKYNNLNKIPHFKKCNNPNYFANLQELNNLEKYLILGKGLYKELDERNYFQINEKIYYRYKNVIKNGIYKANCGKCLYCIKKNTRTWTNRLLMEAEHHKEKFFITLTYNEKNLPKNQEINYRDVQLFLKRLRNKITNKIKYFACAEYGANKERPHYHLIIFGWIPKDLKKINKELYNSPTLDRIWNKGFISIGIDINEKTLKYCIKYLQKINNPIGIEKENEKIYMSKGIAKKNYSQKIYKTDNIYINGITYPTPRYFDKLLEKENPILLEKIREKRKKVSRIGDTLDKAIANKKNYKIEQEFLKKHNIENRKSKTRKKNEK